MAREHLYVYIGSVLISSILPTITSLAVALYIMKIMTAHQKQIKQGTNLDAKKLLLITHFREVTLLPKSFTWSTKLGVFGENENILFRIYDHCIYCTNFVALSFY
jgi:hypothetical protein